MYAIIISAQTTDTKCIFCNSCEYSAPTPEKQEA